MSEATSSSLAPLFATTPAPPYYAVIFCSIVREKAPGYEAAAERMVDLARDMPGFLGLDTTRGEDRFGITVSYWRDEDSIAAWRSHAEHTAAREAGRNEWYEHYELRIAKVERAYGGPKAL